MLTKQELEKAKKLFPFFEECPTNELVDYILRINSIEWCSNNLLDSMIIGKNYAQYILVSRCEL